VFDVETGNRKFESLTKYLCLMDENNIGTWVIDRKNNGTPEHPVQLPFVNYVDMVYRFIRDVYEFSERNKDFELVRYDEVLEKNGLEQNVKSMLEADVSSLDAKCVMALIMGVIRAERFCEGVLLNFFQKGIIRKWLERLQAMDESCCLE